MQHFDHSIPDLGDSSDSLFTSPIPPQPPVSNVRHSARRDEVEHLHGQFMDVSGKILEGSPTIAPRDSAGDDDDDDDTYQGGSSFQQDTESTGYDRIVDSRVGQGIREMRDMRNEMSQLKSKSDDVSRRLQEARDRQQNAERALADLRRKKDSMQREQSVPAVRNASPYAYIKSPASDDTWSQSTCNPEHDSRLPSNHHRQRPAGKRDRQRVRIEMPAELNVHSKNHKYQPRRQDDGAPTSARQETPGIKMVIVRKSANGDYEKKKMTMSESAVEHHAKNSGKGHVDNMLAGIASSMMRSGPAHSNLLALPAPQESAVDLNALIHGRPFPNIECVRRFVSRHLGREITAEQAEDYLIAYGGILTSK